MFGYAVFNVLSERADLGIMLYPTDKLASVQVPTLVSSRGIPIDECRLYRVCTYNDETMELTDCKPTLIPWDLRRLSESQMNPEKVSDVQKAIADHS